VPAVAEHHQGFHKVVFALPGGFVLALVAHPATDRNHRFDEFRPGLDHISFGCADRNQLEKWQNRLDELGITHGVIAETPSASPCPSATQTTWPWSSLHPGHSNRQPAGIKAWRVHGELHLVDEAGHLPWLDDPSAVARKVRSFLNA
jgi:pimeloyl-ACP methyl ester carboxylesterase